MKLLTIIISFLNEGDEVENTLNSIFQTANEELIEIILINDASDDEFDYDSVAAKFSLDYIKLKERQGIAQCRDLAIEKCKTPYFLLLDSHMRFYDNKWVGRIINQLSKNERILLCCHTKSLLYIDNKVEEGPDVQMYGAVVNFYDNNTTTLLNPVWNSIEPSKCLEKNVYLIPCILGAAYACSKEYWLHIKGLQGLMYYGFDETYISLKVWLEGGRCLLDRNIEIGHIYRSINRPAPYSTTDYYYYYNSLLIAELLLPEQLKTYVFSSIKSLVPTSFNKALYLLYDKQEFILNLKKEYNQILKKDFSTFEFINSESNLFKSKIANPNKTLKKIANHIIYNNKSCNDIGLFEGKIGASIFLYHYSKHSGIEIYKDIADLMIDEVFSSINSNYPINLHSGYCGIGIGVIDLFKNSFVQGDISTVLDEIDNKIQEINPFNIKDINLSNGLGGIFLYVLSRLDIVTEKNSENPFSDDFLSNVHIKAKSIITNRETDCDCIDVYMKILLYFQKKTIKPISIYNIINLQYPEKLFLKKYDIGLTGLSGLGLKILFERDFMKSFQIKL